MFELFRDIRAAMHRRAGRRYSAFIIKEWNYAKSDDEMRALIRNGRLSKERLFGKPFEKAWSVHWQKHGAADARMGVIRASRYRSHWYNMGWWNQMIEMRDRGWSHPRLNAEFNKMKEFYWERMARGASDDYYSAPLGGIETVRDSLSG